MGMNPLPQLYGREIKNYKNIVANNSVDKMIITEIPLNTHIQPPARKNAGLSQICTQYCTKAFRGRSLPGPPGENTALPRLPSS